MKLNKYNILGVTVMGEARRFQTLLISTLSYILCLLYAFKLLPYEFGFSRISRADQTSSIRKYLAMAGRKNLILTGRDL